MNYRRLWDLWVGGRSHVPVLGIMSPCRCAYPVRWAVWMFARHTDQAPAHVPVTCPGGLVHCPVGLKLLGSNRPSLAYRAPASSSGTPDCEMFQQVRWLLPASTAGGYRFGDAQLHAQQLRAVGT